jgi:crossover junction endodeoxyribonuclease RusA
LIRVELPWPVSANRYWASRVIKSRQTGKWMSMTYVTKEAGAYKTQVGWLLKSAGVRAPFTGKVRVGIELYPHRPQDWAKRAQRDPETWDMTVQCIDLDNARKVLYDALKGIAFTDDNLVFEDWGRRMEPDGKARVVVTIEEIAIERAQQSLIAEVPHGTCEQHVAAGDPF